jgi:hypothetical protein
MSKSYKLKRGYDILKVLSAMGIGGLTIDGFSNLVSTHHTAQDVVITIVGLLCTLYFAASYMKVNMEKDNLMEKLITTVENNKKWGKINKATAEANAIKIGKLEKNKRGKR